ncbi:BppU family phage baseplate upper protein [Enterococcus faecium]|uniref:BppU family phage baseplate upper protein n=2 Tax=Enterococcus faecium TaxID=1352 RepID=UPI002072CFA5|nr:BppU family phage baseplate upper protein [Enterococcus faecium]MCM6853889.1 BppU family phage baseplate upper protein [Enterococcus faecium]MCM6865801.1 BppU family phage baseplate upper protein [Enterococcus faecium]MCM6883316.1 BppU family phage baseplate upper protein [Enterococcus faecium]MCM6899086.1 BppU family phage baseplate upper protein [Enterococcus faecium]MCM6904801.1 BppU family phage baseplate upper protein [Enterococcus faecium]
MVDRKVGEITVPTEPVSRATKITGFTFKSYDKNAGVLQFNIENQDGSPTDLIDATVRLFMYIYQGEEKKEFPIFDNQIITESYMQGIVKYRIPDMLLSYEGKVDANVYIDFPDGSHTDNLAFTFNIEKSIIDGDVQLNGEYYFKDFQQLLDGVKQEATDAVNAALTNVDSTIEKANQQINEFVQGATQAIDQTVDEVTEQLQATQTKIDTVSQNVTSAQNNLKTVEDKMNQTNQQIGNLGKLKKMYSNSIDFGGYDYSGNPNLFVNKLESSDFNKGSHGSLTDDKGKLHFTSDGTGSIDMFTRVNTPAIVSGKTYTISARLRFDEGTTGDINKLRLVYRKTLSGNVLLEANNTSMTIDDVGKEITIKGTSNVAYEITDLERFYISVSFSQNGKINGGFKLSHIKIEAGSTATPYQPNLLDAPYYLSKVALGKNIANKGTTFPIKSSGLNIYVGDTKEDLMIGQTYTITLKGTKPASQTFAAFNRWDVKFGDLKPVEGLADVWSLTFTPTKLVPDFPKNFRIYQSPEATAGACQIDWLKIEKGDTRTPNISQFKYFGEGLKDSNNPNDYSWDVTPEYTEEGLNNTVSLTEPQSVEGLKNFEDGLQIAGKEVATVPEDTGWVNLTAINGHSWNKQGQIRRIGKLVMFRGSLKGSTLSTQDFCTIPEGFRPSNPTDNYEYQFLLPPQSSNTLDNGGMAYIRPNGVCGLPSFRGTVNLFLAPIQYYID